MTEHILNEMKDNASVREIRLVARNVNKFMPEYLNSIQDDKIIGHVKNYCNNTFKAFDSIYNEKMLNKDILITKNEYGIEIINPNLNPIDFSESTITELQSLPRKLCGYVDFKLSRLEKSKEKVINQINNTHIKELCSSLKTEVDDCKNISKTYQNIGMDYLSFLDKTLDNALNESVVDREMLFYGLNKENCSLDNIKKEISLKIHREASNLLNKATYIDTVKVDSLTTAIENEVKKFVIEKENELRADSNVFNGDLLNKDNSVKFIDSIKDVHANSVNNNVLDLNEYKENRISGNTNFVDSNKKSFNYNQIKQSIYNGNEEKIDIDTNITVNLYTDNGKIKKTTRIYNAGLDDIGPIVGGVQSESDIDEILKKGDAYANSTKCVSKEFTRTKEYNIGFEDLDITK
ncbi:hypothetical protein ACV3UL_16870 [Clostridium perfringens]